MGVCCPSDYQPNARFFFQQLLALVTGGKISSVMASPDLAISYHRLDTTFFDGYVQHATFHSNALLGQRRRVKLVNWYRDRELGRGTFGTVYLERTGRGKLRAVKEIVKDRNSRIGVDYKRADGNGNLETGARYGKLENRGLSLVIANEIIAC